MITRKAIFAMVVVGIATVPARSEPLIEAGTTPDGSVYSVDFATKKRVGDKAEVWLFVDYSKDKSAKAHTSRELWKFYCSQQSSLTAYIVQYDGRGRVILSRNEPDNPYMYEPIVPETLGSFAMNFACS